LGKGSKERLIPIAKVTMKYIYIYKDEVRIHQKIQDKYKDILFLNRNGKQLTRVMVFTIIKELVQKTDITKTISPHTFRHSFATHLLKNGADLRSIQLMLGHESITTTEIYTHIDAKDLQKTILEHHPRNIKNNS
jgi:integrase/recombinase XerD